MKSFHSIAHFAQSEGSGHFYHYHCAVQKAMRQCVEDVTVYVPKNANFVELPQGWTRWFSPFYNRKNRKKFFQECTFLFRQPSTKSRIFFLEFFGRRDFALYALAALLFGKKQDEIWILYRDDLTIRHPKDLKVIRFFSKCLQWRFKKRFLPLTDSELLANYYQHWFDKKLTVLPVLYAQYYPFIPITKEKIVCSWLGSPRMEKGAQEIAHLVTILDSSASKVELDISGASYFPPVKNALSVHLRKAFLTENEYYAALNRSDVILLPYDATKYRRRTSGIFVEAILAGKIPLVKEGSWLAHELKRFNLHELIVNWENPNFFSHIFSLVSEVQILKKLELMQHAYLAFHGETHFARSLHNLN